MNDKRTNHSTKNDRTLASGPPVDDNTKEMECSRSHSTSAIGSDLNKFTTVHGVAVANECVDGRSKEILLDGVGAFDVEVARRIQANVENMLRIVQPFNDLLLRIRCCNVATVSEAWHSLARSAYALWMIVFSRRCLARPAFEIVFRRLPADTEDALVGHFGSLQAAVATLQHAMVLIVVYLSGRLIEQSD